MRYNGWDGVHGIKAIALALGRERLLKRIMLVDKCIANEIYIECCGTERKCACGGGFMGLFDVVRLPQHQLRKPPSSDLTLSTTACLSISVGLAQRLLFLPVIGDHY